MKMSDPLHGLFDWVVKASAGIGFPGLLVKFSYDWWKNRPSRAALRKAAAEADVEEAIRTDRIRSSSISSMEAQTLAMVKSWEAERAAKDETIRFQGEQLAAQRTENAEQAKIIRELRSRVESLQSQVADVLETLKALQPNDDR